MMITKKKLTNNFKSNSYTTDWLQYIKSNNIWKVTCQQQQQPFININKYFINSYASKYS